MKKIIITYLCLLLVCVSLCSCISNTDKTKDDSNKFDESITDTNILYSSERLVTENQTIFASLIEDNPIDKAYHSAEHDDTTQGMVDIEIKFADIWMEELKYSCEKYTELLNGRDKATFNDIQEYWENYISNNYTFVDDIFKNDEYKAYMGRLFLVESASEYRNTIRRRTLYVKYLQFCMQSEKMNDCVVEFEFQQRMGTENGSSS